VSAGSGPVSIYNNLVQANLSNDDGGGIRFLMAGNFAMNVYNNIVVNNVSTHEGGGIALNDTPNVRVFNNTIMKNITTATAVTSNGTPAPAGLSTSLNSTPLQSSLPAGSPTYSDPLLFNNIFWDNRAGSRAGGSVTGIGAPGDGTAINNWDLGEADSGGAIELKPTNSVLQTNLGVTLDASNSLSDPNVIAPYDVGMTFQVWRNNPAFVGAIMATVDLPPNLMGNYHLPLNASPAINAGAATKNAVPAPLFDIDNGVRPSGGAYEIGADELAPVNPVADLSITVSDGKSTIQRGLPNTYTIIVRNLSSAPVANAAVTDILPASFTGATWTCLAGAASGCPSPGSGDLDNTTVTIGAGSLVTFTVSGTVSLAAPSPVTNTATVAPPAGTTDPDLTNNTSTDSTLTTAPPTSTTWPLLDSFNRTNANNLGANWAQVAFGAFRAIRANTNQAYALLAGQAMWNGTSPTFGPKQGAQITFSNAILSNTSLILKASGGSSASPSKFIRVRYQTTNGGRIVVSTTLNGGGSYTQQGTDLAVAFANGNKLGVVVSSTGVVSIYKTVGTTTTLVGTRQVPITGAASFTGSGRIGIQLPTGGRVDNFSGGTMP
jgi:uncharacterized repeat protein (TIGR01451 family)